MRTKPIPSTGEALPVVGLGTYRSFDVGPGDAAYGRLPDVLRAMFDAGGSLIDTSPMYGRAEQTIGETLPRVDGARPFLATKVWTTGRDAGIAQMERSFELLRADVIDLMQIHNLVDWRTHLQTLRRWRDAGRVRYIGITHYTSSAYDEVERMMRAERFDFLQINYSLLEREAERRILPLAQDLGMAVLANRPLGQGALLPRLARASAPAWANGVNASGWAQLALQFVLAHPAVTCVIPASGNPDHMRANAAAGTAPPLTNSQRDALRLLASTRRA